MQWVYDIWHHATCFALRTVTRIPYREKYSMLLSSEIRLKLSVWRAYSFNGKESHITLCNTKSLSVIAYRPTWSTQTMTIWQMWVYIIVEQDYNSLVYIHVLTFLNPTLHIPGLGYSKLMNDIIKVHNVRILLLVLTRVKPCLESFSFFILHI